MQTTPTSAHAPAGQGDARDWRERLMQLAVPTGIAVITWWAAGVGYLFAHTLAEMFSIVVAVTAMVVASTSRQFTRNHFAVLLSVAIGWCAGIDLLHTLVFKGMRLVAGDDPNPSAQLWVSARFIQALAMVMAPLALQRRVRVGWLHLLFGGVSITAVVAIFSGHFPDCFIEGEGLTPFKVYAEYLIMGMFALSAWLLWQRRGLTTPELFWGMNLAILMMIATEFAFTRYASVYAPANLVGHVLKIYAYWFIYLALVRTTLQEPFSMLSRIVSSYDAVPDPTLIIDAEGTIRQANQAAAVHTGLSVEQLVGMSSHEGFHDASVAQAQCPVCSQLGQRTQRFTQLLELPGDRFVECTVTPFVQEFGGQARVQVLHDVTEQRVSEERFRKLFEETRQPSMLFEDGVFIAANRASLDMLDMTRPDQLVGHSPLDISPPFQPDGRSSAEMMLEVVGVTFDKGSNEFEWEHIRATGEHAIAHVLTTVIRMGGKEVLHVVWNDVTRQKQAEKELEDYRRTLEQRVEERTAALQAATETLNLANERIEAILNGTSAGIMLIRERRIEQCNQRLAQLTGYSVDELVGQPTGLLYADTAAWQRAGQEIYGELRAGRHYSKEQLARRKDGSTFWVRLSASALEPSDIAKGIVGMLEDISLERQSAEALRMATEEQQAIFDAATVGVLLSRDQVIVRCNRTMEQLFGYGPDELIGQGTRVLYHDDTTYADVSQRLLDSLARQGHFREERRLVRKDGSTFWCREMVQVIDRDDAGKGFACTFEDISAERAAIEDMARARALAEDAARTKAEFLANMSHEIRTPMNSVIGMALLALKSDPSPKVRNYLQKIQLSSQHLLGLINDILDFSKLEADKMTLEHLDFELDLVLEGIHTVFADKAAERGNQLFIGIDPDVPTHLVGDSLRLEQVLINLVNNAVKFTQQGEITVRVAMQERAGDDIVLRFSVRDTGIGVAPEQSQKLFQSFQQADTSITRKFGGTGLGLAISKRLTELMGGQIGVDSTPGSGSTFWFTARLKLQQATAGHRRLLAPPQGGQDALVQSDQLAGARALLVEDNSLNQEVATEFLQALGLVVDLAEDGSVALHKVQQQHYDVVLMDMQMPVMDGLAATAAIRRLPQCQDLPILAMTANAMAGDRERCLVAGMNDHIAKPIDPQDLVSKLQHWVKPVADRPVTSVSLASAQQTPSAHLATAEILETLHRLPGLDVELGLKRAMGRHGLYLGLLAKYVQGQRDAVERIAAAVDAGQWSDAERAAHTLKGVSAQVGVDAIRGQAERLEQALHERVVAAELAPLLADLAQELTPMVEAIAAQLPSTQVTGSVMPAVAADPMAWQALRTRLIDLLADDDAACEQLCQDNEGLLRAGLGSRYEVFAHAVRQFDFPAALQQLQALPL